MIKFKQTYKKFTQLLYKYIEDFLIFAGLFLIVMATFILNTIAGLYITGIVFLLLGIYFSKYPPKKVR